MLRRKDFSVERNKLIQIQVFLTQFPYFQIEKQFFDDPELNNNLDMSYLSHKEKYEEAIRRTTVVLKKIKRLQSEGLGGKDLNM